MCYREPASSTHHVKPKVKGGKRGDTKECCRQCHAQIHALFQPRELAKLSFADLVTQPEMARYISWRRKHKGLFQVCEARRRK